MPENTPLLSEEGFDNRRNTLRTVSIIISGFIFVLTESSRIYCWKNYKPYIVKNGNRLYYISRIASPIVGDSNSKNPSSSRDLFTTSRENVVDAISQWSKPVSEVISVVC